MVGVAGVEDELCAYGERRPHLCRSQDVRAVDMDKVEIYKSFRPGDIVKAEVISLGDQRSYYLSTAKNEYGVLFAKSVAGTMVTAAHLG